MTGLDHAPSSVLVVDRNDLTREGLVALLDADPRFTVVRAVAHIGDAQAERVCPDLIVVDPREGRVIRLETVAQLAATAPGVSICVLTLPLARQAVLDTIDAGAHLYLLKGRHNGAHVLNALAFLAETGMVMVDPEIGARSKRADGRIVLQQPSPEASTLSEREVEALCLYATGLRVGEIARQLHINHRTVSCHLRNVCHKLHAKTNAELVRLAADQGLIEPQW